MSSVARHKSCSIQHSVILCKSLSCLELTKRNTSFSFGVYLFDPEFCDLYRISIVPSFTKQDGNDVDDGSQVTVH